MCARISSHKCALLLQSVWAPVPVANYTVRVPKKSVLWGWGGKDDSTICGEGCSFPLSFLLLVVRILSSVLSALRSRGFCDLRLLPASSDRRQWNAPFRFKVATETR